MKRQEDGFALVTVLVLVLLLSLLAGGLIALSRTQVRDGRAATRIAEARALEDAAVSRAILGLSDRRLSARWRPDGVPREVVLPGGTAEVTVTDELCRIDLNSADDALLRALFEELGNNPEEAGSIVDSIRDWTDGDDLRRLNGAEAADYRAAGLDYSPRNQPFLRLEELTLVKGVGPDLLAASEPALTLFSGRRIAVGACAGDLVRKALARFGLPQSELSVVPSGAPVIEDLSGRALRIAVRVGDVAATRQQIVRLTGDPHDPFWIHSFEIVSNAAWNDTGDEVGAAR